MKSIVAFSFLLFVQVLQVYAASRTSPPSGAKVVRKSPGSGEYGTISAAVASLSGSSAASIFIYPGTYNEQVVVDYDGPLTIYGYTTNTGTYKNNEVIITNNKNAQDAGGNDASGTLRALSNDFSLYNVNVANTYGKGIQAGALSARGTRQGFYASSFTGYQDTLFADSNAGYQYYSNCYIEGAVDFIYGRASAWFGECTIASNGPGAITANSRETTSDVSYYVIDHSTLTTATSTDLTGKVYLGRPWRVLARVMFQNSVLPATINEKGYTTLADNATPVFMEYGNTGAGADTSKRVTYTATTAPIAKKDVLGSDYASWVDTSF